MGKLRVLAALTLGLWVAVSFAEGARAETRRAFVIGIERYSDGNLQRLSRSVADAQDLAADLEQVGFDKKNITVATDLRTKADFTKKFDAFLKTVQEGDVVLFFFSGHGLGVDTANDNYLLFGDLKSLLAFTRSKDKDTKNPDIVRLHMASFVDAYETDEIPKSGVSALEIQNKIAEKKPRLAILMLDACRSLVAPDPGDTRRLFRGAESGSRLVPDKNLPQGFIALYSASYGESAVESFGSDDKRRNSLFTEVVRSELQRPGQNLIDLAERVKLAVRAIANKFGFQQEPEYYQNLGAAEDFMLIESIGAERFRLSNDLCESSAADWDQIRLLPRRDLIERHLRRFADCPTAELARRTLVNLADSADDPSSHVVTTAQSGAIDDCDRLAASDSDPKRPPEVPGVPLTRVDADAAKKACETAIQRNPNVARFMFNLGRAEQALANGLRADDPAQKEAFGRARLALNDAVKRGYLAALNNLAILYDGGYGVEPNPATASDLLKRAAQQGLPIAMYNLGLRYKNGIGGVDRDIGQAYEWFAKAGESGFVAAMIEAGDALRYGRGVPWNARRAAEIYQRAAEAGSTRAMHSLGALYYNGSARSDASGNANPSSVQRDFSLALLWVGRAAEAGDPVAQFDLAYMMEHGEGLPNPQPEIAERYYRLAAYAGDEDAEIEFAEKLRLGRVLVKSENGADEAVKLLERADSQGSARAALQLANIYRLGDFGRDKQPILAMKYAYRAIRFSALSDPTTSDGNAYHEIAAGIMLAEMARDGEAVDDQGRLLLTKDEINRLERFYGKVDDATKQVKVRRLLVPLKCAYLVPRYRFIWVWDWGRVESPTEPQFRSLERETGCANNKELRDTLSASFATAKKNGVAFADLIEQQIKSAVAAASVETTRGGRRR